MSLYEASTFEFSLDPSANQHRHESMDVCPLCDQVIDSDRLAEINKRQDIREKEISTKVGIQLREQFERHLTEVVSQANVDKTAAIEQERQSAAAQILSTKEEAHRAAQASAQEKIKEIELEHSKKHAELQAATTNAQLEKEAAKNQLSVIELSLEQERIDRATEIQEILDDNVVKETTIRQEAIIAAEAAMEEKISDLDKARITAEELAAKTRQQIVVLEQSHEIALLARLQEQREALESEKNSAINAEKSAAFEASLKLQNKVSDLQRALEKKSNDELGEGAEIDLFESLKAEFEGDKIEPIKRGEPGADILHTIIQNGRECGKIIYDSKNHKQWRNEFVTKLATDQINAGAEHAFLSSHKFPAGARQVHLQDGVVIASPARVIALVQIVRKHMVQVHTLKLSNEQKDHKTEKMYEFITSEKCLSHFDRIDAQAEELLQLDVDEVKAHNKTWKRRGELTRSVQKTSSDLSREIEAIIGNEIGLGQQL